MKTHGPHSIGLHAVTQGRARQSGFSLIELLVALFVVMLIASLVTLNVNSGGQDIELESRVRGLADISSYAMDEAQLQGRDIGLLIERVVEDADTVYRYSWRERWQEGWRRLKRPDAVLEDDSLPLGITLNLVLEDLPIPELTPDPDAEVAEPQVVFYASGETTPGFMELRREDTDELLWLIEWDLLGRFTLLLRGEERTDEFDDQ
ncbi:MAG: GspH/FimT family pseudopilin [Halioglobus sp.]